MKKMKRIVLTLTFGLLVFFGFSNLSVNANEQGVAPLKDLEASQITNKSVNGLKKVDNLDNLSFNPTIRKFSEPSKDLLEQRIDVNANWDYDAFIVNYEPGFGVNMLNSKGQYLNQYVPHGSTWEAIGVRMINGKRHVRVGNDAYIPEFYIDEYRAVEPMWITFTQKTLEYKWEHTNGNGKPAISIVPPAKMFLYGMIRKSEYSKVHGDIYYSTGYNHFISYNSPGLGFTPAE